MDKKWIAAVIVALVLIVAAVGAYVYISEGDDDVSKDDGWKISAGSSYTFDAKIQIIDGATTEEVDTYYGIATYTVTTETDGNKQITILDIDLTSSNGTAIKSNTSNYIALGNTGADDRKTESVDTLHHGKMDLYVEEITEDNGTAVKVYYDNDGMIYKQVMEISNGEYTQIQTIELMDYHIADDDECAVFYMGNGNDETEYGFCDLVADGSEVTVPECSFTYENHTFKGWNTSADGKGTAYAVGSTLEATGESVTLYAQWEESQ